uniref:Uncharacterized protein n=1 Tax=Fusarium oxysporum (strain Fo5176) TaxID=660025 RepID=A0A0D2XZE6_FUSOF
MFRPSHWPERLRLWFDHHQLQDQQAMVDLADDQLHPPKVRDELPLVRVAY